MAVGTEGTDKANMGSAHDREIVAAEVIVTCPARNFVTLKIVTRSGITGIGDATLPVESKTPGSFSIAARTGGAVR